MKIYISASFTSRERLRPIRDQLWARGHEIVSTWLDEVAKPRPMSHDEFYKKLALKDLAEVNAADLVIADLFDPSTSGGRDVEIGFALGRYAAKQLYLVGKPVSVFHQLADKVFPTWEELLKVLPDESTPKAA